MIKRLPRFVITALVLPMAAAFALYRMTGTAGLLEWVPKYRSHFLAICLSGTPAAAVYLAARLAGLYRKPLAVGLSRILSYGALAVSILSMGFTLTAASAFFLQSRSVDPQRAAAFRRPEIETGSHVILPIAKTVSPEDVDSPILRLAFSSDMHAGNPESSLEASRRIVNAVSGSGVDAFFVLGDLAEMGFPGTDLENALDVLSGAAARLPIIALMGNHDSILGGAWRFHRYFNPARYFHLEADGVHLVAIELLWGDESLDRSQKAWLKKTLSAIPKEETLIVLSHCFIRSSGYVDAESGRDWFDHEETIKSVAPILEEAGVDLVVSGHNHYLEYLEKPGMGSLKGTADAVVGVMGGKLDPVPSYRSPSSVWIAQGTFGYLDLSVRKDSLELTFRDENGNALASFIH